ncbi:hypothetical protein X727_12505 [Mesorhizobium sp. L103C119B0]|nr:hypothetical protein X727_12505 [Mesorhizobium sp. L103C119B0]
MCSGAKLKSLFKKLAEQSIYEIRFRQAAFYNIFTATFDVFGYFVSDKLSKYSFSA